MAMMPVGSVAMMVVALGLGWVGEEDRKAGD
jgi:hypothetical protein